MVNMPILLMSPTTLLIFKASGKLLKYASLAFAKNNKNSKTRYMRIISNSAKLRFRKNSIIL